MIGYRNETISDGMLEYTQSPLQEPVVSLFR